MKKIIFLDFDGVITTYKSKWKLDQEKLDLLKEILDATNSEIVISSSWRHYDLPSTIKFITEPSYFVPFPFPFCDKIIGITKKLKNRSRGEEIDLYLKENLKDLRYNYIILDDNNDMLKCQQKNFILTDCDDGLCKEDVEKAISMLNKD